MDNKFFELIEKVKEVGKSNLNYFNQVLEFEEKLDACDLKSKADMEADKMLVDYIQELFPSYSIYSEEQGKILKDTEYMFVIDPLDGTNNFALGIPLFTTNISLLKGNEIIFGLVHNPITDKTYYAYKGEGAFENNTKIKVNKIDDISKSTISFTTGYINPKDIAIKRVADIGRLLPKRLVTFWAPGNDFCLLASGKIEAVINENKETYDFSAGKLIAKEAGAMITDFNNLPSGDNDDAYFVASNGTKIHQEILQIFK